jgi:cyclopropane-fatty-acyl-phospholipid synthase
MSSRSIDPKEAGASSEAIRSHYDQSNEFFALWLDRRLAYSCALYRSDDDDLDTAQLHKMDHHIAASGATGKARVLDIGCGWGCLLERMVDSAGVGEAVGLTLSRAQADWIAARGHPQVSVRLEGWAEHDANARYDAIISIGAFEHFARRGLERADKVAAYRAFFERCHGWLPPSGLLSLQTITYTAQSRMDDDFVSTWIFPESDLPHPSEVLQASEPFFDVIHLSNDWKDYERTCRQWKRNLAARRDEAVALVGDEVVRRYERYLRTAAVAFRLRAAGLLRVTLCRRL